MRNCFDIEAVQRRENGVKRLDLRKKFHLTAKTPRKRKSRLGNKHQLLR